MLFKWSKGNQKLIKTQKAFQKRFQKEAFFVGFNIPQLRSETGKYTCPFAGYCADICYASQGRFNMPAVLKSHEHNFELLENNSRPRAKQMLLEDLKRMRKTTHIRLHNSGDFYTRWYYQMWLEIAHERNDLTFYVYTKSLPFLQWEAHPENFRVTQSVGGKKDHLIDYQKPHSRIFSSHEDREKMNYIDGNESDLPAVLGEIKIGLVYHGNRNLTESNKKHLEIL